MEEIKRGFLKDYYKNGEPKTEEEKDKEFCLLGNVCCISFFIIALGFMILAIYYRW